MTRADAPIGVFDSGVGGLTVVRALRAQLPNESLIYVGDTARVPYGPKSPETVRLYATQIAEWLRGQQVKAIVVACNTATAHALTHLREMLPIPVVGVIEPGARAAALATRGGPIGVIGTSGTIASGAYERAIHALAPTLLVHANACPLLVPMVEEGWADVLGPGVRLIDSAEETAVDTRRVLSAAGLLNPALATPAHRFVVSDAPDRFLALGRRFLDDTMAHVEHVDFS